MVRFDAADISQADLGWRAVEHSLALRSADPASAYAWGGAGALGYASRPSGTALTETRANPEPTITWRRQEAEQPEGYPLRKSASIARAATSTMSASDPPIRCPSLQRVSRRANTISPS